MIRFPFGGASKLTLVIAVALSLAGCGFAYDERVDGPYRLIAIDTSDQMSLCYEDRDSCIGRVDETVFAVGWNSAYVVAARHPHHFGQLYVDKSVTEYFYIVRAVDSALADSSKSVRGPFTASEFEAERRRLGLPQFSRVIEHLR